MELGAAPAVLDNRLLQSAACAVDRAERGCVLGPRGVRSGLSDGHCAAKRACDSDKPSCRDAGKLSGAAWGSGVDDSLGSGVKPLAGTEDAAGEIEASVSVVPAVRDKRASQAAEEAEDEWLGKAGRTTDGDGRASGSGESTRGRFADVKGFGEGGAEEQDDWREGSEPDVVMALSQVRPGNCCGASALVSSRPSATPRLEVLAGNDPVSVPSSELECRCPHSPAVARIRRRSDSTSLMKGSRDASDTAGCAALCRPSVTVGRLPPAVGRPTEVETWLYDADRAAWWR